VGRAFDILEAFRTTGADPEVERDGTWLSLQAIHERTGLPKGTLRRLLRIMTSRGYVRQDERTRQYRLGLQCWQLGVEAIGGLRLNRAIAPYLERLARETLEQVTMWLYEEGDVVCVQRAESSQRVRSSTRIGTREVATRLEAGRVLMAWRDEDELLNDLRSKPGWHPKSAPELLADLAGIRESGIAASRGIYWPDIYAVSAPVRDFSGAVVCAVTVSGPASRFSDDLVESITEMLKNITGLASRELGFRDE
jgi:DNA-binding IclR family transcriptional regulator